MKQVFGGSCRPLPILGQALTLALAFVLTTTVSWAQYQVFEYKGELERIALPVFDTTSKEVEMEDLNGDGWLDIFIGIKQPSQTISNNLDYLYHNRGNISLALAESPTDAFTFKRTVDAFRPTIKTSRCYDVEFADLNGDGHTDLIRPDYEGLVYILWGKGDGTFHKASKLIGDPGFDDPNGKDASYDGVDVKDLNDDGHPDFILAHYPSSGNHNLIFENLGILALPLLAFDEDPQDRFALHFGTLPADNTHAVSIGYVDDDEVYDVVLANLQLISVQPPINSQPKVYFGLANPFTFGTTPIDLPAPANNRVVTIADLVDLNNDQRLDIFMAQQTFVRQSNHGVFFHSGDPEDPYPSATLRTGDIGIYDARYGDFDDDGQTDIITININAGEPNVFLPTEITVLTVSNTNQISDVSSNFFDAKDLHGGIAIDQGDLDQDGDEDLVLGGVLNDISNGNIGGAHIYENRTYTKLTNASLDSGTYIGIKELSAENSVTIVSGGRVTFKSGGEIVLKPGFAAVAGSQFTATTF